MSRSPGNDIDPQSAVPGIDWEKRTAQPVDDIMTALEQADLSSFFQCLPFSHQKEYLVYIEAAKKPETRSRRIEKTIGMLRKLQAKNKK